LRNTRQRSEIFARLIVGLGWPLGVGNYNDVFYIIVIVSDIIYNISNLDIWR
jgi:hypothetical protein